MTTINMNPAATGVITAKGTKGLLLWIQQAMPDFYAILSPQLVQMSKQGNQVAMAGLSCDMQNKLGFLYKDNFARRAGVDGLGQYTNYSAYTGTISTTSAGGTSSVNIDNPAFTDLTIAPASTTTNAASVASTAPASGNIANAISSIANAVAVGTVASAQVSANNTLLQTNLARAQQGLPPLTATTSGGFTSLGDPTTLLVLGAAVLAAVMLSKKST